jgi:hypothetical protein
MDKLLSAVEKWQRDYDDAQIKVVDQTAGSDDSATSDTNCAVEIVGEVTAEQRTVNAKAAAVNLCDDLFDSCKRQAAEEPSACNIKRPKLVANGLVHETGASKLSSDAEHSGSKHRRSTLVGECGSGQSKRFMASTMGGNANAANEMKNRQPLPDSDESWDSGDEDLLVDLKRKQNSPSAEQPGAKKQAVGSTRPL